MSHFVVTTALDTVADDGEISLREALTLANDSLGTDTITFDAALGGQTLTLGGTELTLSSDVIISGDVDGDGSSDITISANDASRVFKAASGTSTLEALTITEGNSYSGGGIFIAGGATVNMTNSTLSGNYAYTGGGISIGYFRRADATLNLSNSTLSGNRAFGGGGIANYGTATVINSTIGGNRAYYAAGIRGYGDGTMTLINSTISGNHGVRDVGIFGAFADLQVINSIILGNNDWGDNFGQINYTLAHATITSSIISGKPEDVFAELNSRGGGLLANNGGPVQTIALKADLSNPALDAGTDTIAPATDAAGATRFDALDRGNNGANISDLGALELQQRPSESPSLKVTTTSDIVDAFDGQTSLREALALANSSSDPSTITFDTALHGETLSLGGTELTLHSDVIIDGDIDNDGSSDITISGNFASRVFNAVSGASTLMALTITQGDSFNGGGIYIAAGATVNVTNSTLTDNSAYSGGGIYNSGTATVTNTTLTGNNAFFGGGGIVNFGAATVTNTTLSGNSAYFGGAIRNYGLDSFALVNSTVTGNKAFRSAAIYGAGPDFQMTNSIVLANDSDIDDGEDFSRATITTSIISGRSEDVFAEVDRSGGGLLADNGGPVRTIALKNDASNPALDAGDDTAAPATDSRGGLRADQIGVTRNHSNISDLGAFELQLDNQTGGPGPDVIFGNDQENVLIGDGGADKIYGLGGDDKLRGGADADRLTGGDGIDWVQYIGSSVSVTVDLREIDGFQSATGGDATGDVIAGFERVYGSDHDDRLIGNQADNYLRGGAGADRLIGGGGDDKLRGGADADRLTGGGGIDWVQYIGSSAGVTVDLREIDGFQSATGGDAAGDVIVGFERVHGSDHADRLIGNQADNYLRGGAGEDRLIGGGGDDKLRGGADADRLTGGGGIDWVQYIGSSAGVTVDLREIDGFQSATGGDATGDVIVGFERVYGSDHDDRLIGNQADNYLRGGAGEDTLIGGGGNDKLRGGADADTFVFNTDIGGTNVDRIVDFDVNDDMIHLDRAIFVGLAAGALPANAFLLSHEAATSDPHMTYNMKTGKLYFDADGTGAEGSILVAKLTPDLLLSEDNFLLF